MIRQHILSVAGQVAAALPPVLILMYLSRTAGLESAGLFAIAAGVSAATFSTSHWGFRTSVLLDRFRTVSPGTFYFARALALLVAAVFVAIVTGLLDIDNRLIAGLILFKVCDGLVDVNFAITQVSVGTGVAIESFAAQHLVKLLLLLAGIAVAVVSGQVAVHTVFVLSGMAALIFVNYRIFGANAVKPAPDVAPRTIFRVFASASWFAIAAALCAIVTSAPRFSLAWMYEGDVLGVIGLTLSVSTFFGMVFYTTWTRHLPQFDGTTPFRTVAARFLGESALIGAGIFVISWTLLPEIVGLLFGYEASAQLLLTRQVLGASVVFFAGMNTCNIYKVTERPWMESASYALALGLAATIALAFPVMRDTFYLLIVSGSLMLVCGLAALAGPTRVNSDRSIR